MTSAEVSERALRLHRDVPVILIHDHEPLEEDLEKCTAGGISGKIFLPVMDAIVNDDPHATGPKLDGWAEHARGEFAKAHASIARSGGRAVLALTAADFRRAKQEGKLAVMLGSEGGKLIEGSFELLREFYDLGLRYLQVAWNYPNQISKAHYGKGSGLTGFGRKLVPTLNEMGVVIDMTHAGREAMGEVLELSSRPIMLSHGGAQGALRRSRYPTWQQGQYMSFVEDDQLRRLADQGGLLGLSLVAALFHSSKGMSDITVADVADHCDYVAQTVGVDVLAIGGDYFPVVGGWASFLPKNYAGDPFVVAKRELPRLTQRLIQQGWRDEDIAKVLGGNYLRFCERVLKVG